MLQGGASTCSAAGHARPATCATSKSAIQQGFDRLLLLVSTVAFAAMAVASLGVTNTIMASIRSRRWQFGILRSIGVTRSGLFCAWYWPKRCCSALVGVRPGPGRGFANEHRCQGLAASSSAYCAADRVPWGIIVIGSALAIADRRLAGRQHHGPAITVAAHGAVGAAASRSGVNVDGRGSANHARRVRGVTFCASTLHEQGRFERCQPNGALPFHSQAIPSPTTQPPGLSTSSGTHQTRTTGQREKFAPKNSRS